MRASWDKMTRWAGLSHNGSDAANVSNGEEMVDQVKDELEQEPTQVVFEAGTEGANEPAESAATESGEVAQLKAERDQLLDRLARLQAEFDNARKREARERADSREYTVGSTVEPFLSVMDNFQLALQAKGDVAQLRSGVNLILKQMEEALKSLNVTPVETVGAQFDPRIHEALGSIETTGHPDHQVLEEIRRGYKIRERLLRPAMVKIAANSAQVND